METHPARNSRPSRLFRALSWRGAARALLGGTLVATILVGAMLPGRQEGSRDSTTAFVPFRPATPSEAALLLRSNMSELLGPPWVAPDPPAAVITRLGRESVTVEARAYVVTTPSPHLVAVSWSGYLVEHEVARAELEEAVGGALTNHWVHPSAGQDQVTFRSASWVGYAAAEIALLGLLFATVAIGVYTVRPILLLPLLLELWLIVLAYVGIRFSPAVWDADFFFQRVVIDQLAAYAAILAVWLVKPVAVATLTAVLLLAYRPAKLK